MTEEAPKRKRRANSKRRPSSRITLVRASRLHRLVSILANGPLGRDLLLSALGVGLRTFYRELELLAKCGVRVRFEKRLYTMRTTPEEAEGRLPFPDPQLSFAEMAELSSGTGDAAKRLAELLARVVGKQGQTPATKSPRKPKRAKS